MFANLGVFHVGNGDLEIFDDFSNNFTPEDMESAGVGKPMVATENTLPESSIADNSNGIIARLSVDESVRLGKFGQGSLPDLTGSDLSDDEFSSNDFRHSSPQIHSTQTPKVVNSVDEPAKQLVNQIHHSTAPCLQDLDLSHLSSITNSSHQTEQHASSDCKLTSPTMKISFSDDGLKTYTIVEADLESLTPKSPLSKIRSGLSQVSQLIVNQSTSPHARRRKQILEAQLLDNHMKSNEQFKNCKTKILLL